jgi:Transposase DDE domain
LQRLRARRTVCLKRLGDGHAGEVRLSRLLNSRHVTAAEMLATAAGDCARRVAGRHVLAIQDTSEINYQAHAGRVKGLGPVGNGTDVGFFIHPALAVDAEHGGIIGLAGGVVWRRQGKIETGRRQRDLVDKESRRWIELARESAATLQAADLVTVMGDRESDIYELFAAPRPAHVHLLVRAAQDRNLAEGARLLAHADSLCEQHRYGIEVPEKPGSKKRMATVAVGFGSVQIARPVRMTRGELPDAVAMTLVVVREVDPPEDAEPVRWVLLTTHAVDGLQAALAIVGWYRKRWLIEQLFRTLKTQGFNVEESQVVEAHALMNLVTAALIAAMQTLQLTLARDDTTRQPASDAFTAVEVRALAAVERKLPGRTAKQLNPHPPHSLAWAAWIVARLGGWTGYASQKPPGPKTMHLGLTQFQALAHGWLLCEQEV